MKKNCSNCGREPYSIACYDCLIGGKKRAVRWEPAENYVPEPISQRAVQLIHRRNQEQGVPMGKILEEIGLSKKLYSQWSRSSGGVNAYFLQKMALAGYDVIYILTGKRSETDGLETDCH